MGDLLCIFSNAVEGSEGHAGQSHGKTVLRTGLHGWRKSVRGCGGGIACRLMRIFERHCM